MSENFLHAIECDCEECKKKWVTLISSKGIPYQPQKGNKMIWISVKDRLPDYGQDVLFVNGKNEVSIGERFRYEEGTETWATDSSIYFNDHILQEWATCRFWMPLPLPPKL